MALKAQFKGTTRKGGVVYVVDGTPSELQEYKSTIPADRLTSYVTEDGKLLLFTNFAMPGKRDAWHPLYKVQTGERAGQYTIDTNDLRFKEAQLNVFKSDALRDKMATAIVSELTGTVSSSVLASIPQVVVTDPNLSESDINKVD
jgi:hypothetical protein